MRAEMNVHFNLVATMSTTYTLPCVGNSTCNVLTTAAIAAGVLGALAGTVTMLRCRGESALMQRPKRDLLRDVIDASVFGCLFTVAGVMTAPVWITVSLMTFAARCLRRRGRLG